MIFMHWWEGHDEYHTTHESEKEAIKVIRKRLKAGSKDIHIGQMVSGIKLSILEDKLQSLVKEYSLRNDPFKASIKELINNYVEMEER